MGPGASSMMVDNDPLPIVLVAATVAVLAVGSHYCNNAPTDASSSAPSTIGLSDAEQNLLTRKQLELIAQRQWKKVSSWSTCHPDQVARLRDARFQTVLHYACLFRAPVVVMESLLAAAPELAMVPNADGEVALHWAIRLSTPNPVLLLLLRANPKSGFWKDKDGVTPISLLWGRHQEALLQSRGEESFPSKLLKQNSWKRLLFLLESAYHAQQQQQQQNSTTTLQENDTQETTDFYDPEKTSTTQQCCFPLHAATSQPCPPGMLPLMIQVYKDQLTQHDSYGQTPLTIAASSPVTYQSCDGRTKIHLLLREAPVSAQIKDKLLGRYPLHIAIESGIPWDDGVESIMYAYPPALTIRDPRTGLHPFLLAVAARAAEETLTVHSTAQESGDCKNSVNDPCGLLMTYMALRADPSVLIL